MLAHPLPRPWALLLAVVGAIAAVACIGLAVYYIWSGALTQPRDVVMAAGALIFAASGALAILLRVRAAARR